MFTDTCTWGCACLIAWCDHVLAKVAGLHREGNRRGRDLLIGHRIGARSTNQPNREQRDAGSKHSVHGDDATFSSLSGQLTQAAQPVVWKKNSGFLGKKNG